MLPDKDNTDVAPETPKRRTIVRDLQCMECGYNLRTLGLYGLCPECGTPVAKSNEPAARWATYWRNHRWRVTVVQLVLNALAFCGPTLICFALYPDIGVFALMGPLVFPTACIGIPANPPDTWALLAVLSIPATCVALSTWYAVSLVRLSLPTRPYLIKLFCVSSLSVLLPYLVLSCLLRVG